MPSLEESAPASREEINAALGGVKTAEGYPRRKEFRDWLNDDPDGEKAAWLKGEI